MNQIDPVNDTTESNTPSMASFTPPAMTNAAISITFNYLSVLGSSNIPSFPAYGVFISNPMRYAGACSTFEYFIPRVTESPTGYLDIHDVEGLKSVRGFSMSI